MSAWVKFGLPLTVLGALGLAGSVVSTSVVTACSSSSSSGGSGSGGSAAGQCPAPSAGVFPPAECLAGSDESSCGTATTCSIAASCGSTAPTSCMPLADNTGKPTQDFRIRRLNVIAPATLANPIIQGSVVTPGITLNLKQCGETGMGSFSWLLRVDPTANTLETGGAALSFDPLGAGYCFANTTINAGTANAIDIAPVKVALHKQADGTFNSDTLALMNIPVYVVSFGTDGGLTAPPQTIVLPISGGQIQGMKISSDGNCIGTIDTTALNSTCIEANSSTCTEWLTDGSLGGYITLAAADQVSVPQLGTTLCALLTQQSGKGTCTKNPDGSYLAKGDFCSTTGQPASATCADAFWMAATFAASAVKINDGTGTPDCQGSSQGTPDAGGADAADSAAPDTDASDGAPE